jgi:hypothetical protein
MKKHQLIIVAAIICTALVSCNINVDGETFGGKTVKGDGNIVTRNFDVIAFNEISAALPATVNFTVSDNYSCTVTVDENLFEYLDIKVENNELQLCKQQKYNNTGLKATEFVIEVTAPSLKEINLAGSGTFNVLSPLEGENMEVSVAGSGDIYFKEKVAMETFEMSVAGSGDIDCIELVANKLDVTIAGSGDLKVASGTVREATASIAGSGDIVLTCGIENLDTDIAGSGDIKARVNGKLKYSIIGSGDISYYGNPVVEGDKAGRGSVTRLGD